MPTSLRLDRSAVAQVADFLRPHFLLQRFAPMHFPEYLKRCVVFIGIKENERFKPLATGFVVSVSFGDVSCAHLVTAEHVLSGARHNGLQLYMRSNLRSGGLQEMPLDDTKWFFHPDNAVQATDVAITPLAIGADDDIGALPLIGPTSWAATPDVLAEQRIGIGEETVIVGLFSSHYGEGRNIPIVRIGNLSALADEPIYTRYCGYTEAHLIEARSIAGLSGSPVFVNIPPLRAFDGKSEYSTGNQQYLLGLMHGHFDVQNMTEDMVVDDALGGRGVNTGIGLVIPVQKIIDTLQHPDLETLRRRAFEEFAAMRGAVADTSNNDG